MCFFSFFASSCLDTCGLANTPCRQMGGPTRFFSPDKTSFLFSNSGQFSVILCLRIDVVLSHESRETEKQRRRRSDGCQQLFTRCLPFQSPRGMRSSSRLAWGNSDMEKSLSLIMLRHKSHSPTPILLTCVHFPLHNDQTQLQPAALGL